MQDKILSIGYNPLWTFEESKEIIDKYHRYIDSIFVSPPFAPASWNTYTTRRWLNELYVIRDDVYQEQQKVIDYARKYNIKIDVAVNGSHLNDEDLERALNYIKTIKADEITCLKNYIDFFKSNYPQGYYVYSFNSTYPTKWDYENLPYDAYCVDSHYLWNSKLRPKDKESRILINSACPNACVGCVDTKTHDCNAMIDLEFTNTEEYMARHIWFKMDIEFYCKVFKNTKFKFKVGSRNSFTKGKTMLKFMELLTSEDDYHKYFDNVDQDLLATYVANINFAYYYKNVDLTKLDVDKMIEYKLQLWNEVVENEFNDK